MYRCAFDEKKTVTTTDENGQQTQTVLAVQKYMDATEDYLNRIEFDKPEDKEGFNYRLTVDFRSDYGGPLAPIHLYTYSSIRLPDLTEPGYTLKGWTLFGSYFRPGDTWRLQNFSFTCMADWTPIRTPLPSLPIRARRPRIRP